MTDTGPEQQLIEAISLREQAAALRRRAEAAQAQADVSARRWRAAAERSQSEQADVERLEKLTWARIVSSLRGAHATDLEREQAERDAADYIAATERARAEDDLQEVFRLQEQLRALGDVDAAYAAALDVQEARFAERPGEDATRLAALAEELGHIAAEERETAEAMEAGRAAGESLVQAFRVLDSAAGWSTWDTFAGGGLLTDMVKHSRMDEARRLLASADHALQVFQREVADVGRNVAAGLRLSGFDFTFDVFFDNIFSDLAVRRRIGDARQAVHESIGQVDRLLKELAQRQAELTTRRADLAAERERLLLP